MANRRLLILALCWALSGCGARSGLLAFDDAGSDDFYHVHRGGGASYLAKFARAAARGNSSASSEVGVRCARTLP